MQIVQLKIHNFRSIREAKLLPEKHNVFLGPNDHGKTTVLEALNLLLNPELSSRAGIIDENDFYRRIYRASAAVSDSTKDENVPDAYAESSKVGSGEAQASEEPEGHEAAMEQSAVVEPEAAAPTAAALPRIEIQAVLTGLDEEDLKLFGEFLVPWDRAKQEVVEFADEGSDPFEGAVAAIRPSFVAWYNEEEDEFEWKSYFRTDTELDLDDFPKFTRQHRRRIGFLIYRDYRGLQKPLTLDAYGLLSRLLQSQDALPKDFEVVLERMRGSALALFKEENFSRVVNELRLELKRYLPLSAAGRGSLTLEPTDLTRTQVKAVTQIYVDDELPIPLQKTGAGTRSLAILAMLLLIARKRGRGIIALEEPETFLFPHAQRRVVDEVLGLASQTFMTTHSPYVLERVPTEAFRRIVRGPKGELSALAVVEDAKSARELRANFRSQFGEALLGTGAVVVEEESIRLWLLRASALLHGATDSDGERVEALELQGVAVVSASGNGNVPGVARLLTRAGVLSFAYLDQVKEEELQKWMADYPEIPMVFHRKRNLEDLLMEELPRDLVRRILIEAPSVRRNYDAATVDGWDASVFADKARKFLGQFKGYLPMHEWILEQLDATTMPRSFRELIHFASRATRTGQAPSLCSIC